MTPEPGAAERLRRLTACVSPGLAASKVLAEQACFRPVTADELPLIGPVPGVAGAYMATGHSVWGMLNGPSTGEAMAALIAGGAVRRRRSAALRSRAAGAARSGSFPFLIDATRERRPGQSGRSMRQTSPTVM